MNQWNISPMLEKVKQKEEKFERRKKSKEKKSKDLTAEKIIAYLERVLKAKDLTPSMRLIISTLVIVHKKPKLHTTSKEISELTGLNPKTIFRAIQQNKNEELFTVRTSTVNSGERRKGIDFEFFW